MDKAKGLRRVNAEFEKWYILLESDPRLPSVFSVVTGRRSKGSWWGDEENMLVFAVLRSFSSRREVLMSKLVSRKVTFIHRVLWPDYLAVCTSEEGWQAKGLSPLSRKLLSHVERKGSVVTSEAQKEIGQPLGAAALDLERRLLVHGEQFHTDRGFHDKRLSTWSSWRDRVGFRGPLPAPSSAKTKFERIVSEMNQEYSGNGRLPWASAIA